jgi:hypothetical protein
MKHAFGNSVTKAIGGLFLLGIFSTGAFSQGLTPMQKTGVTGSDKKVFSLTIMNPYPKEMNYELSAEDRNTGALQPDVKFTGRRGRLGAKGQKKMLVLVPVTADKREVRICLRFPEMQESVRPRVCGDFTAIAFRGHERQRGLHAPVTDGRGG